METNDYLNIIMEFGGKTTLKEYIYEMKNNNKKINEKEILDIFK